MDYFKTNSSLRAAVFIECGTLRKRIFRIIAKRVKVLHQCVCSVIIFLVILWRVSVMSAEGVGILY